MSGPRCPARYLGGLVVWAAIAYAAPTLAQTTRVEVGAGGPVRAPARQLGMGGAYVGMADDASVHLTNPSVYAQRNRAQRHRRGAFGFAFSLSALTGKGQDIDPDVTFADETETVMGTFGLDGQYEHFGVGGYAQLLSFGTTDSDGTLLHYDTIVATFGAGWTFGDGDFTLGASWVRGGMTLSSDQARRYRSSSNGLGVGFLWAPSGQDFRIGGGFQSPLGLAPRRRYLGDASAADLPDVRSSVPGRVALGAAYQFGRRELNVPLTWESGEPLADPTASDFYVLVTFDLEMVMRSRDALHLPSLLRGTTVRAGESVTVSPRLGVELPVVPEWARVRGGSYYEPSRIGGPGRWHATAGASVRVPVVLDWELLFGLDGADGYLNWSVGLGFW